MSFTLFQLILLRSIATGGGEAFYAPSANSLISQYHKNTLATALSIHQSALYAGIIISGYIAGYIADRFGWHMAFYLFGGFGILLALVLFFRLENPPPGYLVRSGNEVKKPVSEVIGVFFNKPTALMLALAFTGMQFVGVGFLVWMPTYLYEKFHFSLARAGFDSTFYHHIAAFIGVIAGARIADRLAIKITGVRGLVQMFGLFLGAPFIYLLSRSNELVVIYIGMAFFGFFRGMYDSNIFAALYDVIEIPHRSTATGIMLMFAFIVGSLSPFILGAIKPVLGLSNGLALLSVVYIISAVCILTAYTFFYRKDQLKTHHTL